jgi:hypothetical protein
MGVSAGFFGKTASQRRWPRSNAGRAPEPRRTTTGERSAAMRAWLRARSGAASRSPAATAGASASSASRVDAWAETSGGADESAADAEADGAASSAGAPLECERHATAHARRAKPAAATAVLVSPPPQWCIAAVKPMAIITKKKMT